MSEWTSEKKTDWQVENDYENALASGEFEQDFCEENLEDFYIYVFEHFSNFSEEFTELLHPDAKKTPDVLGDNWPVWTEFIEALPVDRREILYRSFCNSNWKSYTDFVLRNCESKW